MRRTTVLVFRVARDGRAGRLQRRCERVALGERCRVGGRCRRVRQARRGPQLVGTAWVLGDLPGQILPEARPTIAFSGDGTVSGFGGCNDFNGTYTVDGSKLTFGPLASTKKACPDAVNTIEQAYLTALQATQTYEITSDGKLKLTSPATTLTFSVQ